MASKERILEVLKPYIGTMAFDDAGVVKPCAILRVMANVLADQLAALDDWIPVTERLPETRMEDGYEVTGMVRTIHLKPECDAEMCHGVWFREDHKRLVDDEQPTHWQYKDKPAPPSDEQGETNEN